MAPLSFHRSLYPVDAVQSAVAAYAELATFAVDVGHDRTTVTITDVDADFADQADEFADSFCNHALFETIRSRRGTDAA